MVAKTVSTAANISAGAVLALKEPGRSPEAVPPIVPDLLSLVAESVSSGSHADDGALRATEGRLAALIERYGTLRGAMDALAAPGRREEGISHDKAGAWAAVMQASVAQIDAALRRSPALLMAMSKWMSAHGDTLESRLDAYHAWLESPLAEGGWADAFDQHAEPAGASDPAAAASDADLEVLRGVLLDAKRVFDLGGAAHGPRLARSALELAERIRAEPRPAARVLALVALGRMKEADQILPGLRGVLSEEDLWTLWGDRYFFDGRYDEAVDAFRSARGVKDDCRSRRNLAGALLRSTKPTVEAQIKSAIDLLAETLKTMGEAECQRGVLETMLGGAWFRHPGADRDADLRRSVEHLELAVASLDAARDRAWWAEAHLGLGSAWLALPSGKKLENVQRAMTCFDRAAQVWTREADPEHWAAAQNHLGQAWERLPAGDRAENLRRAIACFTAAAEVKTRESDALGWAMLQNNLGNAWVQMPGDDHRETILKAIDCHQHALEVWSAHNRRADWAATQSNLGTAWALLPAEGEEREKNLRRAVAAYKAALEVRTRAAYPVEWASTQNNLGSALLHMPGTEGTTLKEAIACFERALEVRTREALPIDWAKTQANLGNAWARAPGDRVGNLQHSIECYGKALTVFTRSSNPHQHAHISQKKAEAMDALDELQIMGRG
jgi:tetratricopeptide (TPR) repeat protein